MPLTNAIAGIARRVPFYRDVRHKVEIERLRRKITAARPLNVLIGGGQTAYDGWIFTDREILDVTKPEDWGRLFTENSIDRVLSEHMLEHLSASDAAVAMRECYRYLKPGGSLRLAVPDGYRRDADYVTEAAPPNDGHQVFYNIHSLTELLRGIGFSVVPLEYFDENEEFHACNWDQNEGMIKRSVRFDRQQDFKRGDLYYTSLIVDARKP